MFVLFGMISLLFVVDCTGDDPCMNGGTCENRACTCPAPFIGSLCDEGMTIYHYHCRIQVGPNRQPNPFSRPKKGSEPERMTKEKKRN